MTSGAEIAPYLKAFKTDLFLSANSVDVQSAINDGIAAGLILDWSDAHADPKQKIRSDPYCF
ncbi:MAG: 5'-nucleotidase [Mediterraneibacter faecis]